MKVSGQHHSPASLTPGKTQYSLYRRLGGSEGRSGRFCEEEDLFPSTEFEPLIAHPAA
jgi:hypothetical protein